jgi:hypothetical protein
MDAEINKAKLYRLAEARSLLSIGNTMIWKLIGRGELECVKLGRRAMIPGSSIAALIDGLPRYKPKSSPHANHDKP